MLIKYIWLILFFMGTFTLMYMIMLPYISKRYMKKLMALKLGQIKKTSTKSSSNLESVPILGSIVQFFSSKRKDKLMRKDIRRSLPTFIDYLTIAVGAGLGLDLAMTRVISKMHGPLAEALANTLIEIKYGKPKKEAFKNLDAETNVPDFSKFLTAIIGSEQLGVSLGNTLKTQGQQIRQKRKQETQEKAYKIPIKLIFPLVLFILPGLFIVLLGPAMIQVYDSLF